MTPTFHTLKIATINRETDETISVSFEIPEDLKKSYEYQSGQYLTLRTTIDGEDLRRSYSLCSAPHENEWRVAIKKVEEGKFSTYANDSFKVGDEIQVMTPMGNFTTDVQTTNAKNYVFFASGSGVTPVFSLIKTILKNEPNSNVTLFYGNKRFGTIIFREELEALKNNYLDAFTLTHVLSRENLGNHIQKGRIDAAKCVELNQAFLKDIPVDEVYVCGPEEMIFAVKETFEGIGLAKEKIHFELFNTSKPKKVIDINLPKEQTVESNVTVILDGDRYDLALQSDGENILDAANKAGADLPYACKGGVCCTCKAKIIEGTARMDVNYALEKDEVEAGYILTCQSHPTSEKLIISFDD